MKILIMIGLLLMASVVLVMGQVTPKSPTQEEIKQQKVQGQMQELKKQDVKQQQQFKKNSNSRKCKCDCSERPKPKTSTPMAPSSPTPK